MSERSNISDVAARAGVAVKTVSRVLNGAPLCERGNQSAGGGGDAALDFRPSIAARILSGAKSNQIALIYDNHSPYLHVPDPDRMLGILQGTASACWPSRSMSPIRKSASRCADWSPKPMSTGSSCPRQ
jgi:DNA-binding LacI/PurR family transcriptional regulator